MSYSTPKLAVRDSFDDDDISDDVEDEVFIRDGRNGFKLDEERGVKRPLMAPRRKLKSSHFHNEVCKNSTCKVLCIPCFYGFVALTALLGLIALVVMLIMWFPVPLERVAFWRTRTIATVLIPCTEISHEDVWIQTFPKLTSESSLQLSDVNKDGVLDVIVGYGTGIDKDDISDVTCTVYFNGVTPCGGGLIALDGRTGNSIWQHWTAHTVYWVDCGADLTGDSIKDCLISGRGGVIEVVNGHDGSRIWELEEPTMTPPPIDTSHSQVDTYAARFVQDIDGDGIQDVLATHTEENANDAGSSLSGHLYIISGHNGRLIRQISTPQGEESYYPPQVLVRIDGQLVIVWGTGGIHSSGGLYVVPLLSLAAGDISQQEALYWDKFKGIMSPPALVDVNRDGLEDIVVATFNSSVLAFDGHTYTMLWNYSFIGSESSSTPIPGYFNEDDIPDFLVKYQNGPGSPVYYSSQTNVLDGRNGQPLLDNTIIDTSGYQSGGLTVSIEGFGNDLLIHWGADCVGYEGRQDIYSFLPGESPEAQSQVDLCKLRFNSTLGTKLWVFSEHLRPPGIPVYSSQERRDVEYRDAKNTTSELQKYLDEHPDFTETYSEEKSFSDKSSELPENKEMEVVRNSPSNFRHKEDSLINEESRKPAEYFYPGREYTVPNRGRNRQPGSHTYASGESEEVLPGFLSNSEYPDVHKHGVEFSKHSPVNGQWRHQWQNPMHRPPLDPQIHPDDQSDLNQMNNDQDISSGRMFENSMPVQDEFEESVLYYPGGDDVYPPGQRDERTAARTENPPRGPRLRGDKRGQTRQKRSADTTFNSGIQKLTSSGVLAPSFSNIYNDSIDVIFATYWIPSSENIHLLLASHLDCIEKELTQSVNIAEKYPGMDEISIESAVAKECLKLKPSPTTGSEHKNSKIESLKANMGQMTIYRIRIRCQCKRLTLDEKCSSVLPFEQQSWPTVGGIDSKGYFKSRHE